LFCWTLMQQIWSSALFNYVNIVKQIIMGALCSQMVSPSATLHIPHHNSRTDHPIDFIFLWHSGVGWGRCSLDFGHDPIYNMAARQTSWFHIPD
jgi:hypothetical protein